MKIPVLTYHAARIDGNSYQTNDHVAFHRDLRLLSELGLRVIPLKEVVAFARAAAVELNSGASIVAISLDDGTDFDFVDLPHPAFGVQRSMYNIMKDFVSEYGPATQPKLHATSFVVASPDARQQMDRTCLADRNWYGEDWWGPAIDSGLMDIANHSWDHLHPTLVRVAQRDQKKGSFAAVDTYADADAQIRRATDYLMAKTKNRACPLFAYPYGDMSEYLPDEYLPRFVAEHRLEAAFTTSPGMISRGENNWKLPRYVCGHHWRTDDELSAILHQATAT